MPVVQSVLFNKEERMGVYRSYKPDIIMLSDLEKIAAIELLVKNPQRHRGPEICSEARKATHIVHLGPDIFWNDFVKEDHFDPFAPETRLQDRDLPILNDVEEVIAFLQQAVPDLTIPMLRGYCTHRQMSKIYHYRTFTIPKKTGGLRKIWAPLPRLKAMQKLIQTQIVEKMVIHGAAHGFVAGKSIFTNASEHTNSSLIVVWTLKISFQRLPFQEFVAYFVPMGILWVLQHYLQHFAQSLQDAKSI